MKIVKFEKNIKIYNLIVWSFAYREARNGKLWQELALDRFRFNNRIKKIEKEISHIFMEEHRMNIYRSRFKS